ncbi:hypothetical protein DV711_10560 [Motiliproteus coralliicola]|uniref:Glucosamine inositolphosphorylceramide transferase 1 N-terminal domain-containing protein n=1 Tax=Motiliproteus coralliicola TaxID=2283196 RepID=A0A369WPI7_9GAMM|nr:hypothetical protein [Motiliproteus coralliicola]RDE22979.1 hypothetical protein DV711_10560 [Motiliproteus coralliicola]
MKDRMVRDLDLEFRPKGKYQVDLDSLAGYQSVVTIADPFPLALKGNVYVLAEVEGYRQSGCYFKTLGAFELSLDKKALVYLDELWSNDSAEYSFPFLFVDNDRILLIPDVNLGGDSSAKLFRIYETSKGHFPFGWSLLHEGKLEDAPLPSDKVLVREDGTWHLFVSDGSHGGQLLLYTSTDLISWEPHAANPLLSRSLLTRLANRILPYRWYRTRPWRLGGGALEVDGRLVLPVQHQYHNKLYGEALSLIELSGLKQGRGRVSQSPQAFMTPDSKVAWRSWGTHHIAMINAENFSWVATDGFDGEKWHIALDDGESLVAKGIQARVSS